MSDNNPLNSDSSEPRGSGKDPNFNWRGLILLSIAVMLIVGAFWYSGNSRSQTDLGYESLLSLLDESAAAKTAGNVDSDPLVRSPSAKQLSLVRDISTGKVTVEGYFFPNRLSNPPNRWNSQSATPRPASALKSS